jgi:hypothetical protein
MPTILFDSGHERGQRFQAFRLLKAHASRRSGIDPNGMLQGRSRFIFIENVSN